MEDFDNQSQEREIIVQKKDNNVEIKTEKDTLCLNLHQAMELISEISDKFDLVPAFYSKEEAAYYKEWAEAMGLIQPSHNEMDEFEAQLTKILQDPNLNQIVEITLSCKEMEARS
jgi:hypothetical protein